MQLLPATLIAEVHTSLRKVNYAPRALSKFEPQPVTNKEVDALPYHRQIYMNYLRYKLWVCQGSAEEL